MTHLRIAHAGLLVLENLPNEALAEAAVAAALLLGHVPQAVSVLLRPGAITSLVDAALDEVASPGPDATLGGVPPFPVVVASPTCLQRTGQLLIIHGQKPAQQWGKHGRCWALPGRQPPPCHHTGNLHTSKLTSIGELVSCAGSEACNALSSAVRWLPHDLPLSRQGTGTEEHLRRPGHVQSEAVADSQDADGTTDDHIAAQRPVGRPNGEKESMERSQTGHLDSIAEQDVPHSNGDVQLQEHALENGHSDAAQDGEQYETLTFHVGGM